MAALDIVKEVQDHIRLVCFKHLKMHIEGGSVKCPRAKQILTRLCLLYGLTVLQLDCSALYESGYIECAGSFSGLVLSAIKQLCTLIRPDALNIVEAAQISDETLCSSIGNSYGDIYETQLEWAKNSRMNQTKDGDAITDGFREFMMPLLKGKL